MVAPRSQNLKLEAVSSRLKGELVHPNKSGPIGDLKFSPDGKRILAGDYPGGVLALWDVASGKLVTTIPTGYGYRSTAQYFSVSPDWQTVYVSRYRTKHERVERDGKRRMTRWNFEGDIRAWNLNDGNLIRTYMHEPPRGIWWMTLSRDGAKFLTGENLSGTSENSYESTASLWDVKSGRYRQVEGLKSFGTFSPDGRVLAFTVENEDRYAQERKLFDTVLNREKWSVPINAPNARCSVGKFSHDGRLIFGSLRVFERAKKWDHWQVWMKWWDAATGREVASFEGDKNDAFGDLHLSPDGKTLAALNFRGSDRKLFLFDVPQRRLIHTTILCEKTPGQSPIASRAVFSPDGKWLVVITRSYPEKAGGDDVDPRDLPQPRILLIEAATGEIRETMIAPQSYSSNACFSPDGRTLATDGHGRVLLWDMTKMPALTSR